MVDTRRLWRTGAAALIVGLSASPASAQSAGGTFKDCADCPEMVVIPAGRFLMGAKPDPSKNFKPPANQQPQHAVTLKSFALGKHEVTQEQWQAVMGANPSKFKGGTRPVETVSWNGIQEFIEKLNAKTGKRYRLPTESEWEYAARASSTTTYSFGDDAAQLDRHAWFYGNDGHETHPVGEKTANAFGLHDMYGNVWEWVQDCWTDDYARAPVDGRAVEQKTVCYRDKRGGSFNNPAEELRSAHRSSDIPGDWYDSVGFRLAQTLP